MYRIANCYLIEKWKPNAVRCCRKSLILLWVGASRNAFRHIWFYLWLQGVRDPYIMCSLFTASCHIREGESVIVLRCLVAFSDSASWGVFIYLFIFITVWILESSPWPTSTFVPQEIWRLCADALQPSVTECFVPLHQTLETEFDTCSLSREHVHVS